MQSAHVDEAQQLGQGKVHIVDMEMNDVELFGSLKNFIEHHEMVGKLVLALVIVQPKGLRTARDQPRCRLGITAREQGYVMPSLDQRLG
jgi:hypothetical protein